MAYKRLKLPSNLSRKTVATIKRDLSANKRKMPKLGWCVRLDTGQEICRDRNGYYLVGDAR